MSSFPIGILGWTGLVGQTLFHQLTSAGIHPADIATYNSKNLQEIRGVTFQTLYIACMPATKWWVNLHPEEDLAILSDVLGVLDTVTASKVILFSTVDVLQPNPEPDQKTNEESAAWATHPYGHHRRLLEVWVQSKWPTTSHILRLPALFGRGLKKNALYDLIHDNNCVSIHPDSEFQWYNLAHLLDDCNTYTRLNIRVAHLVSPPIAMREIINRWFPDRICGNPAAPAAPVKYNLTTGHGGTLDGAYITTRKKLLQQMESWISWELHRLATPIAASNIGFTMTHDAKAVLHHLGIRYLEVAPTRGTDFADFQPVSMQSLLYGSPITNIFQTPQQFVTHLQKLAESAQAKGIRTFVFGSPKQRDLGLTSWMEAIDLFHRVGNLVAEYGITLCLEPNAKAYNCTWLTTAADVLRFIQTVNHPNIRMTLDTGNYCLEGDTTPICDIPIEWIGHVQVSAANLHSTLSSQERATAQWILKDLWSRDYRGTVSYEAKEPTGGFKEYCRGLGQFMNLLEIAHIRSEH